MPRFFVEIGADTGGTIVISGEDAKHISLSLRARTGEEITLCDGAGRDYECVIKNITKAEVEAEVLDIKPCNAEPDVDVTLYQAMVKSDKFDFIVQKCTELGVKRIVPVLSQRCISKPDGDAFCKKLSRWNKIAKEAAMQSGRGVIPEVLEAVSFEDMLCDLKQNDLGFVCYEAQPRVSLKTLFEEKSKQKKIKNIAFFVGPEGGISDKEINSALENGVPSAGLGNRILRTETAPLCVVSLLMMLSGNME